MKLLWLCNMAPSAVQEQISGKAVGGLWVDHVLTDLRSRNGLSIRILCPGGQEHSGALDQNCSYKTFRSKLPYEYLPEQEIAFRKELTAFSPDVIHIWGTEYAHTYAMVKAAEETGFLDRIVISIQGLCCFIADHYCEGLPYKVQHGFTFRDVVRRDNISQQQKKFVLRGELEKKALEKARHVIGRTHWDKACTSIINPDAQYHFCNETLREPFYSDCWQYAACKKHRIFAPSSSYPVKGFHYLLQALALVRKVYPDVTLAVPGQDIRKVSALRQNSYGKYLTKLMDQYALNDCVEFLGTLDARAMKENYLAANVFVQASTIENSPNALGEAMLLGAPCVASDVGGVTTMLIHNQEGFVYPSTAPYMLAHFIQTVFAMEDQAEAMGAAARSHARKTHSPENNLQDLLQIYEELAR